MAYATDLTDTCRTSVANAFPDIADIRVDVAESGRGLWDAHRQRVFIPPHLPGEYVECSNSLCHGGGFPLGSIIRDMVRARETERETRHICKGELGVR